MILFDHDKKTLCYNRTDSDLQRSLRALNRLATTNLQVLDANGGDVGDGVVALAAQVGPVLLEPQQAKPVLQGVLQKAD